MIDKLITKIENRILSLNKEIEELSTVNIKATKPLYRKVDKFIFKLIQLKNKKYKEKTNVEEPKEPVKFKAYWK